MNNAILIQRVSGIPGCQLIATIVKALESGVHMWTLVEKQKGQSPLW